MTVSRLRIGREWLVVSISIEDLEEMSDTAEDYAAWDSPFSISSGNVCRSSFISHLGFPVGRYKGLLALRLQSVVNGNVKHAQWARGNLANDMVRGIGRIELDESEFVPVA